MLRDSELAKYLINNKNQFKVAEREIQKIKREKKFINDNEANGYIIDLFKKALNEIKNNPENDSAFLFSISMNTVVLTYNQYYFHIQIYDADLNKPEFTIKSLRPTTDFSIHNYRNQGLTITNHLLDRYIQYFKQFLSWKEKFVYKDELEKELMIKLKNGRKVFSKELTDTVYLIADNTYFVLKKQSKNTISLVTMRPFDKILELPKKLKRVLKNPIVYEKYLECELCSKEVNVSEQNSYRVGCDKTIVHTQCLQKKYQGKFKAKLFDTYGTKYLNILNTIPLEYLEGNELIDILGGILSYIEVLQEASKPVTANCVHCNKIIYLNKEEFYERIHDGSKIHKTCAHDILDIKSTEKIFAHSGYNGLLATKRQQEEQREALLLEVPRGQVV